MSKAIRFLALLLGVFLVTQSAHAVTIYYADMLLEYRYYEKYKPSYWTTPDALRLMADSGADSDSANMKIGFAVEVYPLNYWGYFFLTDIEPFHNYGTVFGLPLDATDFSAWEEMTYTFWDDADDDDIIDTNPEDYTQFSIAAGTYRKLALPQNISLSSEGIISWDEVEYADYYKVRAQDVENGVITGGLIYGSDRIPSDGSGRMSHDLGEFMDRIMSDTVVLYIVAREVADIDNIENGVLVPGVEHIINQSRIYFDPMDKMICEGDFNNDGDVDGSDLALFAADFGRTNCIGGIVPCPCDIDSDCDVDDVDIWLCDSTTCDFDHDGDFDSADLAVCASHYNRDDCCGDCPGDFNGDGDVDGSDLAIFAADFGRTNCP